MNTAPTNASPATAGPTRPGSTHRTGRVVAGLVAGLMALTGCGGDDDAEPSSTEPASTAAPTTEPATTTPPSTEPEPEPEPETETETETEPAAGPVAFEILADIDASVTTGRFVVADGADLLGCDEGRFYGSVDRELWTMTCESGPRSGEIKMAFEPLLGDDETFTGAWTIESGTGDFETLTGEGELVDVRDVAAGTITSSRTGEIRFDG